MSEPIELIEVELKHKQKIFKDLKERLDDEENQARSTTVGIQILRNKIGILEKAIALLKGGDKEDGKN